MMRMIIVGHDGDHVGGDHGDDRSPHARRSPPPNPPYHTKCGLIGIYINIV